MAQREIVVLEDDLDQSPATTTLKFGVEGKSYVIDLNDAHAEQLRAALQPWVKAARRQTGSGSALTRSGRSGKSPAELRQVRDWAKAQGIAVSSRGRIPASVLQQYDATH